MTELEEMLAAAHKPPKSDAERISELEAQLTALTEGYAEGVQNA